MAAPLSPSGRGLAVAVFLSAAAHAGTLLIAGSPTEPVGGAGGGAGMSVQLAAAGGAPGRETGDASEGGDPEEASATRAEAEPREEPAPREEPTGTTAERPAPEPPEPEASTEPQRTETTKAIATAPSPEPPDEEAEAGTKTPSERADVGEATDPAGTTPKDASDADTTGGGSNNPEADPGHLRAEARGALGEHFRYPPVAVRRGWEGEVRLAFRVTAEGDIRDIQVARGSGHAMLDDAARRALERVAPLEAPGRSVELKLPVVFRLEG
ncbi:outer membrane transport energization protein TonB [Thiohalospira halophila DSM 15071]|uniref:Protein TonB n=1 Tax=Thiohalospira halophila DSM 15071 TaxID=1123397 RepID=A0A1I1QGV8_9GAMM|nr:energy transducer TonB [Thiohalospira halophila]SFD17350.1 outer membrane transport energization protein TonB [Thiohalospira halophila DSM 15071]